MKLEKDGITTEAINLADIARLKRLGWGEVKEEKPVEQEQQPKAEEKTPEQLNQEAIDAANKKVAPEKVVKKAGK